MYSCNTRHSAFGVLALGAAGLICILIGLLLLTEVGTVNAQLPDDAEYVGARECSSCHRNISRQHSDSRHALALQDTSRSQKAILADFSQGDTLRQVQFPGEDAPRAFTADDIAFAVGSGRHVQRYLFEIDRNEFAIFPAEWNIVEGVWQPYTPAVTWPDPAYDWNQNCAGCHTTGLNAERGRWKDEGVQCESCHGPGSAHIEIAGDAGNNPDEAELGEIRASITLSPDAQICGSCHSQGTEPEGGRPYPVNYRAGDELLVSGSFSLTPPDDSAHEPNPGHANAQFNEWLQSAHAGSLTSVKNSESAAASCLECHSTDYQWTQQLNAAVESGERGGAPLKPITIEAAQYGVTCSSCHGLHSEEPSEALLIKEPYELCADCHRNNESLDEIHHPAQEMFEGLPVIEQVTGSQSQHFAEGALCTTCHMPPNVQTGQTWFAGTHTMSPALPGEVAEGQPDSCTGCHSDLSPDYMQRFIEKTQGGIQERLTNLQVAIGQNPGTADWVQKVAAFVAGDGSLGVHNYGYTTALLNQAELETGVVTASVPATIPVRPVEDPTACAECHEEEYRRWQLSPHANASLSQTFLERYATEGRPSYCMSCHASGYDPRTEKYVFEGVTCSNCHYVTGGAQHPPGPVEVATNSAVCGNCHTGAHAPSYDEWLASSHSSAQVDCADCHTAHDNGLVLEDVNATCSSCHQEAMTDEIHMGEEMTCLDCHMEEHVSVDGVATIQISHRMRIDPAVCADCHGNTHLLSFGETRLSEQGRQELESLREEVTQLQTASAENLNSGIVGGAIGALVLVGVVFFTIRLGRMR